ncbi:MAG: endonuclease/exonuclease/phosphatase family protein, partial [Sedimenticola sp.]
MTLNVLCWNVRGIMSSTLCLNVLLDKMSCDVAFVTEHKLQPYNSSFMDSIHSNYSSITVCDDTQSQDSYHPCGRAGAAILYKNYLKPYIEPIDCNSRRIAGLKLVGVTNRPLYFFSAYLPSDNNILAYREEIDNLDQLCSLYGDTGHVILAGDMNASIRSENHVNIYKSIQLKQFVQRNCLNALNTSTQCKGPAFTYMPTQTMLDYIFTDDVMKSCNSSCEIVDEGNITSTSDHLPISTSFTLPQIIPDSHVEAIIWTAWHKINDDQLQTYQHAVSCKLEDMQTGEITTIEQLNSVNTVISDCL